MGARKVPRGTFLLGGAVALVLGVPLVACALLLLARAGVADPTEVTFERSLRLAAIFAGLPAFLTGGGVARLVAHHFREREGMSLRRAIGEGAAAMALGGIALTVLAAVPVGGMPEETPRWAWVFLAGAIAGALTGAALAALTQARMKRHAGDVAPPPPAPEPEPEPAPPPAEQVAP